MTLQLGQNETVEPPAPRKLWITVDRLVTMAIAIPLFAVQAAWTLLLLWAGLQVFR